MLFVEVQPSYQKIQLLFGLFLICQCHKIACKQISHALETFEINLEIVNKYFFDSACLCFEQLGNSAITITEMKTFFFPQ